MASYRLKRKIFFMGSGNFAKAFNVGGAAKGLTTGQRIAEGAAGTAKAIGTVGAVGLGATALAGGFAAKTANDVITGKPLEH